MTAAAPAVALEPIPFAQKAELRPQFDAYLTAHADLVDPTRQFGDPTAYGPYDLYWSEPERAPYWIMADGARAGFVLVNRYSASGRGCDAAIAEFHVTDERRRRGLGAAAALAAFATRGGLWELQVFHANPAGANFWPKVIAKAQADAWEQIRLEDRTIHRFRPR